MGVVAWLGLGVMGEHAVGFTSNTCWGWLACGACGTVVVRVSCGGLFVYCIVVVSIYFCCDFVVLLSFVGHSVDALALGADEGRGGLR